MFSFPTEQFEMLKVGVSKKRPSLYSFVSLFYSKKIDQGRLWLRAPKKDLSSMQHHFEYKRLKVVTQERVLFVNCVKESGVIYPVFLS